MTKHEDTTQAAGGSPLERGVRPRAWAIFVDGGNARMWSTLQPHVQKLADAEGLDVTPLYGPDALAAERKRCETALRLAREGYASEAATGLPVLPQWRERVLKMLDEALGA